jgi:hypothetical protein
MEDDRMDEYFEKLSSAIDAVVIDDDTDFPFTSVVDLECLVFAIAFSLLC